MPAFVDKSAQQRLAEFFAPDKERRVPGQRAIRTALRTVHLAAMAVLVGGHFFDVPAERLYLPLAWTAASGVSFVALEVYCSPGWLYQVGGLVTFAKVLLLATVPIFWLHRTWIMIAVVVVASVNSHMPSKYRHYSLLTGKVEHEKKG